MMRIKPGTITVTFSECTENGPGMQKNGKKLNRSFNKEDLNKIKEKLENIGCECYLIDLYNLSFEEEQPEDMNAYVLVVKGYLQTLLKDSSNDIFNELSNLDWDTKKYIRGSVKNSLARYNLCFDDFDQEPDYLNKKGRIYSFSSLPLLNEVRKLLNEQVSHFITDLKAEGNYYYDKKCGIGYHGDAERSIVIGLRLCGDENETLPLRYKWFYKSEHVGKRVDFDLSHGDLYFMGEKSVGNDWLKKNILTLRHAAGAEKYTD